MILRSVLCGKSWVLTCPVAGLWIKPDPTQELSVQKQPLHVSWKSVHPFAFPVTAKLLPWNNALPFHVCSCPTALICPNWDFYSCVFHKYQRKLDWGLCKHHLPCLIRKAALPADTQVRCFKLPGRYSCGRLALLLARDCPKCRWWAPSAYANLPCVWMTGTSSWAPQTPQVTVPGLLAPRTRGVRSPDPSEGARVQVSHPLRRGNSKPQNLYCSIPSTVSCKAVSLETERHQLGLNIQLLQKSPAPALWSFAPAAWLNPPSPSTGTGWGFTQERF